MVVPKDMPVPRSILQQNRQISSTKPPVTPAIPKGVPTILRDIQDNSSNSVDTCVSSRGTRSGVDDLQKGIDSLIETIIEKEHPHPVYSPVVSRQFQPANTGFLPAPVINTTANLEGPVIHTYSSLNAGPGIGIPSMAPSVPSVYIDLDPDTSDEMQNDYPRSSSTMYMSTAMPIDNTQRASQTMPFESTMLRGPPTTLPFETVPRLPLAHPSQTIAIDSPFPTIMDTPSRPRFDQPPPIRPPSMYIPPPRTFHRRARGPRPRNFNKELYGLYRNQLVLKKFICPQCGHRCLKSSDLTRHLRVHTGEKPFDCKICFKKFGEKHIFYQHMRKFHPEFCQ